MWQALIDNAGAVVAVFTVVLAVTTVIYVVVSWKMLKQSRNALLADMIVKLMEIHRSDRKEEKDMEHGWAKGYTDAFMKLDVKFGRDITNLIISGLLGASGVKKWDQKEARGLLKKQRFLLKKKEKARQKLKEKKRSGTS